MYFERLKRFLLKKAVPASAESSCSHYQRHKPFINFCDYDDELGIARSFVKYSNIEQIEYIFNMSFVTVVEPTYGFICTKNGEYFRNSIPYCDDYLIPDPYSWNRLSSIRKICLEEAISIRYGWDNYWHFINDAVGTLIFIYDSGVSKNVPIIVPEQALQHNYVREVLFKHDYFKNLKYVFQSQKQWIECKKIWFGKVMPNTRKNLLRVCGVIDDAELLTKFSNENIFLTRGKNSGRNLSNIDIIEKIAQDNGFSIVDTAQLDVTVQKATFKSAKVVVGIHGAGMSNLVFAYGSNPKVLEIFPGNSIPPHYYWLSRELGYEYRAMLGSNLDNKSKFHLDENRFSEEIKRLLLT